MVKRPTILAIVALLRAVSQKMNWNKPLQVQGLNSALGLNRERSPMDPNPWPAWLALFWVILTTIRNGGRD